MTDLVERLEEPWVEPARNADDEVQKLYALCREAAAEIERLRVDAARYRWLRLHLAGDAPMISIAHQAIDADYVWQWTPLLTPP